MATIYSPDIDGATSGSALPGWISLSTAWTVGDFNPSGSHTQTFGQAAPTNHSIALNTDLAASFDAELVFSQEMPAVGSGVPSIAAILRSDAAGRNLYMFQAVPKASYINLRIVKMIDGAQATIGGVNWTPASGTYVAGFAFNLRVQIVGNALAIRAWPVGGTEPTTWHYSATDSSIVTAGYTGFYMSGSGTNSLGINDLSVYDTATGYTPAVTVTTPSAASTVSPTLVTGTYTGYEPDGMNYVIGGTTPNTAMTNFSVTSIGNWQGYVEQMTAGTHYVTVGYGQTPSVTAQTSTFTSSLPTVAVTAPEDTTAGAAFALQGTYSGVPPQGLQYVYDGLLSWTAATQLSANNGTWIAEVVAPAAGTHTLQVRYTEATSVVSSSVSLTTAAAAVYHPDIDLATTGQTLSGWVGTNGVYTVGDYNPGGSHIQAFGQAAPSNGTQAILTGVQALTDAELFFNQVIVQNNHVPSIGALLRTNILGQAGYVVLFEPTNSAAITIVTFVNEGGGTYNVINSVSAPLSYGADGMNLSCRVQIAGNVIKAKCWNAETTEPAWQSSTTDSTWTGTGYPGFYTSGSPSYAMGVTDLIYSGVLTGITPTLAITTPSVASTAGTTPISGTYTGYAPIGLLYGVDSASPTLTVTNFSAGGGVWSGNIAAIASGSHTLTVAYEQLSSVTATSGSFTASLPTIAVNAPAGTTGGGDYTMTGTYTGVAPTGVSYAYDGTGVYTAASSFLASAGTWSATATAPVEGSHTVVVKETNAPTAVSASVSFTTSASVAVRVLTVNTPGTSSAGSALTISGTYSGGSITGLNYSIDGGTYAASASPTIGDSTYSFSITAPAAGTHTITVQEANSTTTTATSDSFTTVDTATVAPNNSAILYSPANWAVSGTAAITINAGAYFSVMFSGNYIGMTFDTSLNGSPLSEVEYRIDAYDTQAPWTTVDVQSLIVPTIPSDDAASAYHLLEFRMKSSSETINRWNMTSTGTAVRFTGLLVTSTSALEAPVALNKSIWIFGDSITEAVRSVNQTATYDTDRNAAGGGWAYMLRDLLGAEVGVIGFGAHGLTRGGSGNVPALPQSYTLINSATARSFDVAPDMILINESQNDSDASAITAAYITVLNGLLSSFPSTKIVAMRPFSGANAAAVQAAVAGCSSPASVTYLDTTGFFKTSFGADSLNLHPTNANNRALVAPTLANALRSILYS